MDIQILSGQLVQFLAPFLPYLVKGGIEAGKAAAAKLGEKFSETTWEKAKSIWGTLHPKIETKPAAQEAVRDAVENPQDADTLAALRLQLKKLLTEDEEFAKMVSEVVHSLDSAAPKIEIHQHAGDDAIQIGTANNVEIKR